MNIQKKVNVSEYMRLYGSLLTSHQQEMLRLYHDCDISLFEISEQINISRQAVRDAIVRGEKALYEFEDKLKINQNKGLVLKALYDIVPLVVDEKTEIALERLQCLIDKLEE